MCLFLSLGLKTSVEVPVLQDSCVHCPEWLPNPQAGRKLLSSRQCMAELIQGQWGVRASPCSAVHAVQSNPPPRTLRPGPFHLQVKIDTPSPSPGLALPSHLSTRFQGDTAIILVHMGA